MITQRGLRPEDRPLIAELLEALPAFTADERAVALELVDATLAQPSSDGYRFVLSFHGAPGQGGAPRLAGYLCYGRTPMTQSTYDLYWIATSPDFARSGVARGLVSTMEGEIAREGGGLVRVETGSREGHGAAVRFYDAVQFTRAAVIADFYAPGDDLIIYTRRVAPAVSTAAGDARAPAAPAAAGGPRAASPAAPDDAAAPGEPALYDAAFGYRDYAAERDFLLACARRFGARPVQRVLSWACGPARHLEAFAELGVGCAGADGSAAMIAYAERAADARGARGVGACGAGAAIRFCRAELDERPDVAPVDLSFVPLSAIHQLATPAALERHLRLAASLLLPGGVHVIEATHPADLTPSGVHRSEWTEVRGEQSIDARLRIHVERANPDRVVPVSLEVVCSARRNGGAPRELSSFRRQSTWYIPDLAGWRLVAERVPELSLIATLGDFNVDVPFEHAAAWRLILVLKRL
ncbi:bifunctional GNAT family N-acetyltransferase/class I SAM-dependent methyltransferase [Sorangium sp. So ce315]|uniref:GNAT family N-acetyltransferase n=1 Tax=Sorangium sp. So ce315 TaxID=3133299 RepID=UPI003F5DE718